MIQINPTGVTAIWGGRGSGKTTLAQKSIKPLLKGRRVVVIDPMATDGHARAADAAAALYEGASGVTLSSANPAEAVPMIYAAWAASQTDRPIFIICDEAPAYLASTTPNLERVMFQGRHRGFGMLILGQRPAAVHAQIRSQVETSFWMRLMDHVDLDTARRVIGPERASELSKLSPGQFIQHPEPAPTSATRKGTTS